MSEAGHMQLEGPAGSARVLADYVRYLVSMIRLCQYILWNMHVVHAILRFAKDQCPQKLWKAIQAWRPEKY